MIKFPRSTKRNLSEYSLKFYKLIIKQENVLIGSNKLNISKDILEILNKIELIN